MATTRSTRKGSAPRLFQLMEFQNHRRRRRSPWCPTCGTAGGSGIRSVSEKIPNAGDTFCLSGEKWESWAQTMGDWPHHWANVERLAWTGKVWIYGRVRRGEGIRKQTEIKKKELDNIFRLNMRGTWRSTITRLPINSIWQPRWIITFFLAYCIILCPWYIVIIMMAKWVVFLRHVAKLLLKSLRTQCRSQVRGNALFKIFKKNLHGNHC